MREMGRGERGGNVPPIAPPPAPPASLGVHDRQRQVMGWTNAWLCDKSFSCTSWKKKTALISMRIFLIGWWPRKARKNVHSLRHVHVQLKLSINRTFSEVIWIRAICVSHKSNETALVLCRWAVQEWECKETWDNNWCVANFVLNIFLLWPSLVVFRAETDASCNCVHARCQLVRCCHKSSWKQSEFCFEFWDRLSSLSSSTGILDWPGWMILHTKCLRNFQTDPTVSFCVLFWEQPFLGRARL